ncbi:MULTISPECIES: penicillin-binding protein 1A [Flavobacterium]|jgi:penicillin-binding protein 1A|uniref:penicillin-binding protein 1A n=1 Tax=Flavobacterium TaxID=237 RepID=UPI00070164A5|nr:MULTISPECIES: PBP1A family penicillin-binding protein [Flavobacterium]MBU7569066.1 PBP1A family penicillin-binding protein [Flavobacterium sp.]PZO23409.1 MAG: PBP1A family penicillin-binding protein [Flavobacteriaceae bacterium]THD32721.1 MAG: PBP1A family penicillin-binding protein [Flavobacterium johnsoniae]KQS52817.1 penicillin-binding protein [Flavobacterium sp. Leaf359]MDQ7959393.1 PBP1A family penicillin-binding protein [Flavobacterium lindanitolerans]
MATKKKNNTQQVKDVAYYNRLFWKIFLYGTGGVILFFLFASWGLFGSMPSFEDLENPESNLATEIISSDGETIGKFYNENRTAIKYSDLPKHLVDALVATEDERFYEHSGIDARGTFRAIVGFGSSGGASTITQQLAKQLFHGERSKNIIVALTQKVKEWIIATRLERQYTKSEIITMYFNVYDFNNYAIGIRSAAKTYFSKEPKDLTVDESAMLVGMFKNSSLYNPVRNEKGVKNRRNVVLSQMVKAKIITEAQKEKYSALPIKLDFQLQTHKEGTATYFREYLRDFMKNWAKNNPKKDGKEYDIYRDGLKIYTTIDSRMQLYAEEAVSAHLANLQKEFFKQAKDNKNAPFIRLSEVETEKLMMRARKNSERWRIMSNEGKSEDDILKSFKVKTKMRVFTWKGEKDTIMTPNDSIRYYKHFLQTGVMAMEPQTGHVKVWVGGINYKHFQYDHVGQGARQVGSTFKPFVYAAAIEQQGYSPCDSIIDAPYTIPKGRHNVTETWTPRNSNGTYKGMVTLKYALAQSINTVSAKLIDKVGPDAVIDLVKKLGVKSNIPSQPSIALGAVEITVEDMVAAYSTFANQGVYIKPQVITRIEDKNGVVLYEAVPESHDVLNKDIAYAVIKLLEGVTESGSGGRLRTDGGGFGYEMMTGYPYVLRNPIAGKTGTTQNQSDGWFVGMVPNLATGVWVGNEDRSAHFKSITYGQGAVMALPIWGLFMKKCYADKELKVSKEPFERPANLSIKVDCWKPAVKDTTNVDMEEQNTSEFDF